MPKRDLRAALGEAKDRLDADMPATADQRVRARLDGGPPRPRHVRWGRVGAVAAALTLAIAVGVTLTRPAAPDTLDGFAILLPSKDLAATASADGVAVRAGSCVLRDGLLGSDLQLSGPARLRRQPDGVEVAAGTVFIDVDHSRARAAPYRVRVSHGSILVLGTQFTVTQFEGGGEVTLHRGAIEFRADDGQVRRLAPGESLRWPLSPLAVVVQPPTPKPLPVEPARPTTPNTPTPKPPPTVVIEPPKPFDAEALLEHIAMLRSRGQYEDAATALTDALKEPRAATTDERLSFELGAILTRQLHDATRGCAHWRAHLGRFPQGRYAAEISQARSDLACTN